MTQNKEIASSEILAVYKELEKSFDGTLLLDILKQAYNQQLAREESACLMCSHENKTPILRLIKSDE